MRAGDTPEDREIKNKGKATAKNIEGKLQEALGHVTGDPEDKIKGKAKQAEAAAMHTRENIRQDVSPSQAPISEPTPGQSGYGTSDPYNSPQGAVPGQVPAPGTTLNQPGYGTSDPNYPQDQGPLKNIEGKIQEAAGRLTGDPEDQARGRAKQDVPPGQRSTSGPVPGQPGYDQYPS